LLLSLVQNPLACSKIGAEWFYGDYTEALSQCNRQFTKRKLQRLWYRAMIEIMETQLSQQIDDKLPRTFWPMSAVNKMYSANQRSLNARRRTSCGAR
jgi:hypothetical protein